MKLTGTVTYTANGSGTEVEELRQALNSIERVEDWDVDATLTGDLNERTVKLADRDSDDDRGESEQPELDAFDERANPVRDGGDANDANDTGEGANDANDSGQNAQPYMSELRGRRRRVARTLVAHFPLLMNFRQVTAATYNIDADTGEPDDRKLQNTYSTALSDMFKGEVAIRTKLGQTMYYQVAPETLREIRDKDGVTPGEALQFEPEHAVWSLDPDGTYGDRGADS